MNFSFASPVAEDRTSDAMEGISDPQLTPEDLRHQPEEPPSLTLPHNEEIIEGNLIDHTGPTSVNVSISEEVLDENQVTASEEIESPGLPTTVHDVDSIRKRFLNESSGFRNEWIMQSAWFQANWENMQSYDFLKPGGGGRNRKIFREYQQEAAKHKFRTYLLRCTKPKLFSESSNEEPCNSPALIGCSCQWKKV